MGLSERQHQQPCYLHATEFISQMISFPHNMYTINIKNLVSLIFIKYSNRHKDFSIIKMLLFTIIYDFCQTVKCVHISLLLTIVHPHKTKSVIVIDIHVIPLEC